MNIIQARTPPEIDAVRQLFREYEAYLDVDLCFQQFEAELAHLPGKYAPPSGTLLLAMHAGRAVGCGALRRFGAIEARTCEMKRLFVRPAARGMGVGRQIAMHLIAEALRLGYFTMVLDTLTQLKAALQLYASMGFIPTQPYYDNPLPGVVYLKLDLRDRNGADVDGRGGGDAHGNR